MPRTPIESETLTLTETRPLALAHRGARLLAEENTIAAFELALEHGCDGFECDLRLTADSEIVVCHDAEFLELSVAESKYSELVSRAEAGNKAFPPRLEELVSRFGGRAYMDLDLKVYGMAARLAELLGNLKRETVIISSFLSCVLDEMRSCDPSFKSAWICDDAAQLERWREIESETIVLHFHLATLERIRELHAAGKRVMVWAAEQEQEIEQLMESGVEGIISGHTQLLAATVRRSKVRAAALGK